MKAKLLYLFLCTFFTVLYPVVVCAAPMDFKVTKGWVAYHIDGKMFGFAAHPVDAVSQQVQGEVRYAGGNDLISGNVISPNLTGILIISVKSLRSGDNALDANAVATLKGDKYPDITFELMDTYISEADMDKLIGASASTGVEKVKGRLTVAGVSKIYDFDIKIEKIKENKFKLITNKEIKFTDFNITPPSMGAVSVLPDQIFIRGEIIVEKINNVSESKGGK